jgi:hypothetical protein
MVKKNQWEFQDPKMEVLYHIKAIFCGAEGANLGFQKAGYPLALW